MAPNPQLNSPLFGLPAELRAHIYFLALSSSSPIIDPTIGPCDTSEHKTMPLLGTALFRTCQMMRAEVDSRLLYSNEFSFTRPRIASNFLLRLPDCSKILLTTLTFDLRENVTSDGDIDSRRVDGWRGSLTFSREGNRPGFLSFFGLHLLVYVPPIRNIVFDLRRAQEKRAQANVPKPLAIRGWGADVHIGIAAADAGIGAGSVCLRCLDRQGKVIEMTLSSGEDKELERERLRTLTKQVFGNDA